MKHVYALILYVVLPAFAVGAGFYVGRERVRTDAISAGHAHRIGGEFGWLPPCWPEEFVRATEQGEPIEWHGEARCLLHGPLGNETLEAHAKRCRPQPATTERD